MPGDLWAGYLQAQAADVAETEREEEKKKQRLQEQLQKLNMESLRRGMERDAREWEIEQAARTGREETLSGLSEFIKGGDTLGPEQWLLGQQLGIDLSGLEDFTREQYEPSPEELAGEWRIEAGLQPKAGAGSTRSVTDAERAERYSKIPEDQRTEYQKKFLKKYFEGTRRGTTGDWLDDILGGEGGVETPAAGEDLDAQILQTQKEIRELLKSLK